MALIFDFDTLQKGEVMNLLDLIKRLFGDLDFNQLLSVLIRKALDGIEDPDGCKAKLLSWIETGTFDDRLRADPLGTIVCVLHVILSFADKYVDHDDRPVIGQTNEGSKELGDYASALSVQVPAEGFVTDVIAKAVINKLIDLLKDKLVEMIES